jgi:ATP-dependent RNA circularization protein (DNA/RNA ligase family)
MISIKLNRFFIRAIINDMLEYPKIETLYQRDKTTNKVITNQLRFPEFGNIRRWQITEKVDGTNVRVGLLPEGVVRYGGRTDNAQMPAKLIDYLQQTFTLEQLQAVFKESLESEIVLFGEGYGEKIQKGGSYRQGMSFRLFDVLVGEWWLEPEAIADVATKLGIFTVPILGEIDALPSQADELKQLLGHDGNSTVAIQDGGRGVRAEGIVARTVPMLFTRRGQRLMWKLKFRDF